MEVTLTQDRQIYESGGIALPLSAFFSAKKEGCRPSDNQ